MNQYVTSAVVRKLRDQQNMTQAELAERVHVSRSSVESWESGQSYPSIDSCVALSETFHLSMDYFFLPIPRKNVILDDLSEREKQMLLEMLAFFDEEKKGGRRLK